MVMRNLTPTRPVRNLNLNHHAGIRPLQSGTPFSRLSRQSAGVSPDPGGNRPDNLITQAEEPMVRFRVTGLVRCRHGWHGLIFWRLSPLTLYTLAKFVDTMLAVDPVTYATLGHDVGLALVILLACGTHKLRIGHFTPPAVDLDVFYYADPGRQVAKLF